MLFSDCLNRTVCLCFICKDTISAYEIKVIVLNLKIYQFWYNLMAFYHGFWSVST